MNETLFSAASVCAIVAWVGLCLAVVAPIGRWRAFLLAASGRAIPLGLCVFYAGVLIANWGQAPGGGFSSLAAVVALFSVPGKMLGGWIHFLAFDLWVGRWIVDDLLASGLPRGWWWVVVGPTFMFGPLGLLLYLGVRAAWRRA